jgi:hypothetical protein
MWINKNVYKYEKVLYEKSIDELKNEVEQLKAEIETKQIERKLISHVNSSDFIENERRQLHAQQALSGHLPGSTGLLGSSFANPCGLAFV